MLPHSRERFRQCPEACLNNNCLALFNQKVEWLSDSLPILDETLDTSVLDIMNCWPDMGRSATLLQYWLIYTYKEGWCSNHISLCSDQTYLTSNVDLKWPLDFMKSNRNYLLTKYYLDASLKFKQHLLLEISCLQSFYTLTSGDLWPSWKTIVIIYSPRVTNVLSLKFKQLLLLEISCFLSCINVNF